MVHLDSGYSYLLLCTLLSHACGGLTESLPHGCSLTDARFYLKSQRYNEALILTALRSVVNHQETKRKGE